jgi:primary-amine oxidase
MITMYCFSKSCSKDTKVPTVGRKIEKSFVCCRVCIISTEETSNTHYNNHVAANKTHTATSTMIFKVFVTRNCGLRTGRLWFPNSSFMTRGVALPGRYCYSNSPKPTCIIPFHFYFNYSCRTVVTYRTLSTTASTTTSPHPLDPLTADEITQASEAVRNHLGLSPVNVDKHVRFASISLNEPPKQDYIQGIVTPRRAEIVALNPTTGIASEYQVDLNTGQVVYSNDLPRGVQPLLTPDDCDLAEAIVQSSPEVAAAMRERYNIVDMSTVACDPWSIHLASEEDRQLTQWRDDGIPGRLVQTFLYHRQYGEGLEDNVYAHPIDIVPVVDLLARKVVTINGMSRDPPTIPNASVQYHRNLVKTNSYLETEWRQERLTALDVVQPDGPSFDVSGNQVEWQKWKFRVGFNYREGLVLHDVSYNGRPILHRASLVEMAVPYADPHPPYQRKCAFDIGDYGLGFCANSLELGCDCLGHIHYFDAVLSDSLGNPVEKKKVICLHEEDNSILWKHVEYRNGHNETRRGRELIISSIATVVNYEYLFYWHFRQDGCIDFKIKLSGELSTNLLSEGEETPSHGVMVAPGVNAQIHQHMFVARLDMAVDSHLNTVSEINIYSEPASDTNPYRNAFGPKETVFETEADAQRVCDSNTSRYWKISNAEGKINWITGKPTAYKLQPFNFGPSQPVVFTDPDSAVSQKGESIFLLFFKRYYVFWACLVPGTVDLTHAILFRSFCHQTFVGNSS